MTAESSHSPAWLAAALDETAEELFRATDRHDGAAGWAAPADVAAVARHLMRTAHMLMETVHHSKFLVEELEHAELLESDVELAEQLHTTYEALNASSAAADTLSESLHDAHRALSALRRSQTEPLPLRTTTTTDPQALTHLRRQVLPHRRTWGPGELIEPDPPPTAVRDADGLRWIPGPGFWVYPDYHPDEHDQEWGRSLTWSQLLELAAPLTVEHTPQNTPGTRGISQ